MHRKIRFVNIDDFMIEIQGETQEVRIEAINEPYIATLSISSSSGGEARKAYEPALRFTIHVTAMDGENNLFFLSELIGGTFQTDEEFLKAIAARAEERKAEYTRKLTEAGFTVKKGMFEL